MRPLRLSSAVIRRCKLFRAIQMIIFYLFTLVQSELGAQETLSIWLHNVLITKNMHLTSKPAEPRWFQSLHVHSASVSITNKHLKPQ